MAKLRESRERILKDSVAHYETLRSDFELHGKHLMDTLAGDARLKPYIHSTKYRTKDPAHLLEKLQRKEIRRQQIKERPLPKLITPKNLLDNLDDLVGVRLLHLHTKQMADIHPMILTILTQNHYTLNEDPMVYVWDIESEKFFQSLGLKTKYREEMYTSVHYVVSSAARPEMKVELQVRTLMEEVWGEVSHSINYPVEDKSPVCREQIRVLARITSGCTRLVDSIFLSSSNKTTQDE